MKNRKGFTLVELLVVIAIIGVLVALLLPAVQAAREAARRTQCMNNIKQWSLGVFQYEGVFDSYPGTRFSSDMTVRYNSDTGWMVAVLPYVEQDTLYRQFENRTTTFAPVNVQVVNTQLKFNSCPSAEVPARVLAVSEYFAGPAGNGSALVGDYAGNRGYMEFNSPLQVPSSRKKEGAIPVFITGVTPNVLQDGGFRDGKSNTFLLWESAGTDWVYHDANNRRVEDSWENFMLQYTPDLIIDEAAPLSFPSTAASVGYFAGWAGINTFPARMWDDAGLVFGTGTGTRVVNRTNAFRSPFSYHPNIVIVVRADGSTAKISEGIGWSEWAAQCSRNGGEVVP